MGPVVPAASAVQDLPEPTSYRGQHMIDLPVDDDAWLRFKGISYWLAPTVDRNSEMLCSVYLLSEPGLDLTVKVYDEAGQQLQLGRGGLDGDVMPWTIILKQQVVAEGDVAWRDAIAGTSLTFRLNYQGSVAVKDVVVPIDFGEHSVAEALAGRRIYFKMSEQPLAFTSLAAQDRSRPADKTPLIYLHGYEDPDTGLETIGTRLPPIALTPKAITTAWQTAKTTGYFDPAIFPNVPAAPDQATRAGMMLAVADLDAGTVVQQLKGGARLAVMRDVSGTFTYRFVPAPQHCRPGLVLVEHYRLTSVAARYGGGRTIKTFSLLPGERTSIRVSTYKRSTQSTQQTSSILDSVTDETQNEFGRTVNSEQSNQSNASKTFEYRAEAEAQVQGNWGWGSASAKVSGGVSGSSNSAREELTKNLTNAVSQNTARASSKRDVQIDTSLDLKLEEGEETAVERTLANVNLSHTLNFVFRQMTQEYITLLHLVDVRVAFFNGHAESRDEVALADLDRLLADCVQPDHIAEARDQVLSALRDIVDYEGRSRPELLRSAEPDGNGPFQIDTSLTSSYTAPDGREHTVPGIIIGVDQHVLRTDGVTIDSFLGAGNALDDYSTGLQEQAVRGRQIDNDQQQAETEKLRLALQLIQNGDTTGVGLYQRLFPIPQVVNQIDHAAVSPSPAALTPADGPGTNGLPTTATPTF
jgi:hypothetical protein